jgi:hypothetical protein
MFLRASDRSEGLPLLIWTDAMYEPVWELGADGDWQMSSAIDEDSGLLFYVSKAVLSITLLDRFTSDEGVVTEKWFHSRFEVGHDVISQLLPGKKTYIGQLESLAGAAPYYSYDAARFNGRQIYHWIDNVAAVAGLSRGYSGKGDTARIVNSFNVRQAYLRCRVWWEWIPSKQNIADLPSRWAADEWSHGEDIEIIPGVFSRWIDFILPPFHSWTAPLEFGAPSTKRARGKRGGVKH